jgi:hypothetical protein
VDAADYTVWRNSLGSETSLAADGDGDRIVDHDDYLVWRDNYGNAAVSEGVPANAIPEPATAVLLLAGALAVLWRDHLRVARSG